MGRGLVAPTSKTIVDCDRDAPKKKDHTIMLHRVTCFFHRFRFCRHKKSPCPHSEFVLHIQRGIGSQTVLCPRWENLNDRLRPKEEPDEYVPMERQICIRENKMFSFCHYCPNSDASQFPQAKEGWLTVWRKKRKRL